MKKMMQAWPRVKGSAWSGLVRAGRSGQATPENKARAFGLRRCNYSEMANALGRPKLRLLKQVRRMKLLDVSTADR